MNMINPYEAEGRFDLALSEISSDMIQQFHRHWLRSAPTAGCRSAPIIDPANFKRSCRTSSWRDRTRSVARALSPVRDRASPSSAATSPAAIWIRSRPGDVWSAAAYIRQYQIVASEGRPVFSSRLDGGQFGARHPFQTGIWPLSSNGRMVDLLHRGRGLPQATLGRCETLSGPTGVLTTVVLF